MFTSGALPKNCRLVRRSRRMAIDSFFQPQRSNHLMHQSQGSYPLSCSNRWRGASQGAGETQPSTLGSRDEKRAAKEDNK